MKRNYTSNKIKDVSLMKSLEVVQFTLNGRIHPSKRKTVNLLKEVRGLGVENKLIVHMDFIYIAPRFAMFNDGTKRAIINEICSILRYAETDKNIVGIVMHTDWPIQKKINDTEFKLQYIADNYSGPLWNTLAIQNLYEFDEFNTVFEKSIVEFGEALINAYGKRPPIKVYLENTTKIGPNKEGSLQSILDILVSHHNLVDVYGVCYDTEHHYAVTGEWLSTDDIKDLRNITDVIVHLNTVPKEVKPCSGKDRHSETTIAECSYNTKEFYQAYADGLSSLGIPWVREVHESTMFRELEQCQ